jgi:pimeloyl-ACP methyl ester carboxylesterase
MHRSICGVSRQDRLNCDANDQPRIDLLSMISGSAQDFKLVLDYLPAYLPEGAQLYNIMGGISLGGHTAWRMAALAPGQFHAFLMIVGSPNLKTLLLSRLGLHSTDGSPLDYDSMTYEEIRGLMKPRQQRMWPRTLDKLVGEGDREVREGFPTDVPILLCNGKFDKLVPAKYTASWVETRKESKNIEFFVQENTGHSCTKEMVIMVARWLGDMFQSQSDMAHI